MPERVNMQCKMSDVYYNARYDILFMFSCLTMLSQTISSIFEKTGGWRMQHLNYIKISQGFFKIILLLAIIKFVLLVAV